MYFLNCGEIYAVSYRGILMILEINVTKKIETDVLVVGGGTAGVFAAISAAKSGAKTTLIEKNSMLGGTMTVASVNFPGLFFAWGNQIISGPCFEAIERVIELGGGVMPEIPFYPQEHWKQQISINRFLFAAVISKMCQETGVKTILNAMVTAVFEEDEGVVSYITEKSGITQIKSKKVIDATGDANLVCMAGYPVNKSETQQPASSMNHISGFDFNNVSVEEIYEKFSKFDFPDYITADSLISYLRTNRLSMHIPCKDADTSEGKTKLEFDTLALALKIIRFYKSIKGLENIVVDFLPEETGVRETNRIVGEREITAEEYIKGYFYKDSVCYAFYPIDLHVLDGIKMTYHDECIVGKIPYRALIPKNSKHILVAGRCISSDTLANSAIRVEAVCMATGQVAGCAAAVSSKNGCYVKNVPYSILSDTLKSIGAVLPNN